MESLCVPMCGAVLHLVAHDGMLRVQWRATAGRAIQAHRPKDAPLLRIGLHLLQLWRREGHVNPRRLASLLPPAGSFTTACWLAAASIPRGSTCTYGQLAARAGREGAARAAASAMARNPLPPFIPCHRVVARGGLGGFCGVESKRRRHWAIRLKCALLESEGVSASYTSPSAPRKTVRTTQRRSHP
ncbi:MAG: methylated-DNA--[protein]-cysteine S-methyltransferase [Planctomycetes bacterium]|nr:methylated-DNA--[protein]-cysteine S-methyltransferase [Planctomycetota bacterium]